MTMTFRLQAPPSQPLPTSAQRVRQSSIPVRQQNSSADYAISPSSPTGRRASCPDPPSSHLRPRALLGRQQDTRTSKVRGDDSSMSAHPAYFSLASHPAPGAADSIIRETQAPSHIGHTTRPIPTTKNKTIRADAPDIRIVLAALNDLVPANLNIYKLLEVDMLIAECEQDLVDLAGGKGVREKRQSDTPRATVFGVSLRESSKYAFTSALFNGHELHLPIVVFNCVEELYRTGIYQPDLFRVLPNRKRLSELVRIFNSPDPQPAYKYSRRQYTNKYNPTLLHHESTQDICALLMDFLRSLPEPILPPYLFDAIWEAGELDKEVSAECDGLDFSELLVAENQRRKGMPLLVKTYSDAGKAARIKIIQHLLCLLPLPNFALLVYLLAFFSHVAMMQDVNGVCTQELGRFFGSCVFGGRSRPSQPEPGLPDPQGRSTGVRRDGKTMMCWFLKRWSLLSNGLFELWEAFLVLPSSAIPEIRIRGLEKSVDRGSTPSLSDWVPTEMKGHNQVQELEHSPCPLRSTPPQRSNDSHDLSRVTGEIRPSGRRGEIGISFNKKRIAKESDEEPNCLSDDLGPVTGATTTDKALTSIPMSTATSTYSSAANERLLDVTFPALFDELHFVDNFQSDHSVLVPSADDHDPKQPSTFSDIDHAPAEAGANKQLLQAQAKVHSLERQLQKSDVIVAQALEVMFRAKRRIDEIDDQLEELEIILRCGMPFHQNSTKVGSSDSDNEVKLLKDSLDMAMMERRKAHQIVTGLRGLMAGEL